MFHFYCVDFSETFGSKINLENIPGTPMEPEEYGTPGMADQANTLYGGLVNDQMALISDGQRASLKSSTVPSSPKLENNLNNVINSHDRTGEMVKFNLNHNHDQNISTALVMTGPSTKRSSLSMSVLEIVETRKNSKQDQEVRYKSLCVLLYLPLIFNFL